MRSNNFRATYLTTYEKGLFPGLLEKAEALLKECTLCPRRCSVDRSVGEEGFCRAGGLPEISSYGPHFGEERPLVGRYGSGTIFLTHCNLGCIFCQNYEISRLGDGQAVSFEQFSRIMVHLQEIGCHNINFVTPSHFAAQILKALPQAVDQGLTVPLVYNTGGYDSVETLRLLDGVFDIYMPDFKYTQGDIAAQYSRRPTTRKWSCGGLKEMHRQVGDLDLDEDGIAVRGLLVRHLVLPEGLAGTPGGHAFPGHGDFEKHLCQYHGPVPPLRRPDPSGLAPPPPHHPAGVSGGGPDGQGRRPPQDRF